MKIRFFCDQSELNRERRGYFAAFSQCGVVILNDIGAGPCIDVSNESIDVMPPTGVKCVVFPEAPTSPLPGWLVHSPVPTVCFQIDTFAKPQWRALWSTLFDYVVIFHPGYEPYFFRYGQKKVLMFPHAVNAADYADYVENRRYEVGWVGSVDGPLYKLRRDILPILSARYAMNDWHRCYNESETPRIYSMSRIVVNIGRDDYPQDANLRCFEAMAAGALLITRLPSELEQIGFRAGEHFVGFHEPEELPSLIDSYLHDSQRWRLITSKARELVLRDHSYDARAATLISTLNADSGRLFAPARQWAKHRTDYVYLHYFCKRVMLKEATAEFRKLLVRSPAHAMRGLPWLVRCWQHSTRRKRTGKPI